jgi:hypothetical protein
MATKLENLLPKAKPALPEIPRLADDKRHREAETRYKAIRTKLASLDVDIAAELARHRASLEQSREEHERQSADSILAGKQPAVLSPPRRYTELQEQRALLERQMGKSHRAMIGIRDALSKETLDEHREWRLDLVRQQHAALCQALELATVQDSFDNRMESHGLNSNARQPCQAGPAIKQAIATLEHQARQAYGVEL